MTAPRIDTVRKDLHAVLHAIGTALEHLEDLHALAYDRPRAAQAQRRSQRTDYALDTHGDPKARAAYEQLATRAPAAATALRTAITGALELFDTGQIRTRRDTTADATTPEIIDALARHHQRHANGTAGSTPTIAQPLPAGANRALDAARLQNELDTLRSAVRKAGDHPDRRRLTPLEQDAWATARGTRKSKRKKR